MKPIDLDFPPCQCRDLGWDMMILSRFSSKTYSICFLEDLIVTAFKFLNAYNFCFTINCIYVSQHNFV